MNSMDNIKQRLEQLEATEQALIKLFKFLPPDELLQVITKSCFAAAENSDEEETNTLAEVQHLFYDLTQYVKKNNLV